MNYQYLFICLATICLGAPVLCMNTLASRMQDDPARLIILIANLTPKLLKVTLTSVVNKQNKILTRNVMMPDSDHQIDIPAIKSDHLQLEVEIIKTSSFASHYASLRCLDYPATSLKNNWPIFKIDEISSIVTKTLPNQTIITSLFLKFLMDQYLWDKNANIINVYTKTPTRYTVKQPKKI